MRRCYNYNKIGHVARDCRLQDNQAKFAAEEEEEEVEDYLFMVTTEGDERSTAPEQHRGEDLPRHLARLHVLLEKVHKKHCRRLIAELEERVSKKLREKDSELATVNKKLVELEAIEIEKAGKKPDKKGNRVAAPVPKVTGAELERRQEEERLSLRNAKENKKKEKRIVLVTNTNHEDSLIEVHSVEEAIEKISIGKGRYRLQIDILRGGLKHSGPMKTAPWH